MLTRKFSAMTISLPFRGCGSTNSSTDAEIRVTSHLVKMKQGLLELLLSVQLSIVQCITPMGAEMLNANN